MAFPPRVDTDVTTAVEGRRAKALRHYWLERAAQHTRDSYLGIPLSKFPEDLRAYEHILWDQQPDFVLEIGTLHGASTLWFRDRLVTQRGYREGAPLPRVIATDIDVATTQANLDRVDPAWHETITLFEGDICDPALAERIRAEIPTGANLLMIEDSAHIYDTTRAALELYADLVPSGGYLVIEDGCVDVEALRLQEDWPRGVLPALDEWLNTAAGADFERRRDLEFYGITCHPKGFLQRR
jgi:cephalosporin hydroxylase